MTYATQEHCLINDSQAISFKELTDTTHGLILVTKWNRQTHELTDSKKYTRGLARTRWVELVSQGYKPFSWA